MRYVVQGLCEKSSAEDRQPLGIAASSINNVSGNKNIKFPSKDCYYDSNEWYVLSKNEKDKVLKARINRYGGNDSTKSGGQSNSGEAINNR